MKKYILVLIIILHSAVSLSATKIYFWHSMAGKLGNTLNEIINEFNLLHPTFNIISVYKGTYPETLTSTVAAFRSGRAPDMVQILDIGTATMLNPKGIVKPLSELLAETSQSIDTSKIIKPILDYYSDNNGQLLALPFNVSTAVLYYNKDHFKNAKLDPEIAPSTWKDVETYSKKLIKNGVMCGITVSWPTWVLIESFSMTHNIPLVTKNNGYDSYDVTGLFDSPELVNYINRLSDYQKTNVFRYGGRVDDAQSLFTSGKCAMYITSSGSYADLDPSVDFKLGVAPLPYLETYRKDQIGCLIGGAAIWSMIGLSNRQYKGIAKFFQFLISPRIQARWQLRTGYLSIIKSEYLPKGHDIDNKMAIIQKFILNKSMKYKGIRFGNYVQIRELLGQQLEVVLAGYKNAKEALKIANDESNLILKRFNRNLQ